MSELGCDNITAVKALYSLGLCGFGAVGAVSRQINGVVIIKALVSVSAFAARSPISAVCMSTSVSVVELIRCSCVILGVMRSVVTADYYDRLKRIKKLIFDKDQRDKYLSTQLYINLNNTDMFSGNEDFINEVEQNVRLANILEAKGNPKANYVVEKSMDGYSIELLSFDEAKDKLRKSQKYGNYALYAKFDNPLVIDADGKNWNDIYAILEPSEKTTFKAEYDSKSNTLVLSDEKGEFSKLTVDGTLESVLPSMARAITNRYGKFFAATVLNQAKDKLNNSSVAEVPVRVIGKRNTREIAEFAQEQGYDGVIFKNLRDNGGRNVMVSRKTVADIYVTFTPETIKSADTVTYGDDGKVIPLSKRFSADEDIRYSEKISTDGEKYVDVDEAFYDNTDGESVARVISNIISSKFNNLISVNNQKIRINATTKREWTMSESAQYLMKYNPQKYNDKLKAIVNADEILKVANNWIGEEKKHIRKDNIVEFARGNINYKVGENGYCADVVVGIKADHSAVLYDIKNIYSKKITEDTLASQVTDSNRPRSEVSSVDNTLSQSAENVNSKFSEKMGKAEYEKVIKSLEKDNAALREDVKDLKELVKVQGKVTHGEVFTKTSVEAVAKKLARDFGMRGEKTELVKMLNEYYSSIASSASDNNLNFTDVMENSLPIAQYINEAMITYSERITSATENLTVRIRVPYA